MKMSRQDRGACVCAVRGAGRGARRRERRHRAPSSSTTNSSRVVLYRVVLSDGQKEQIDSDAEEEKEKCGRRN